MLNIVHRAGISDTFHIEVFIIPIHRFQKQVPVFLFRTTPSHFGKRRQTGKTR